MYKLHLILKYLRKRRIAWVALIAVTLCTTMVLVVNSVMGGWLGMFRDAFHSMSGDIIVKGTSRGVGFPYYQEMIDEIVKLPEVEAASPVLQAGGVIQLDAGANAYGVSTVQAFVQVYGYREDITQVNGFGASLHRQKDAERLSFALRPDVDYGAWAPDKLRESALHWKGMITGSSLIGVQKTETGEFYRPSFVDHVHAFLILFPQERGAYMGGGVGTFPQQNYWVVDDSHTMATQFDANTVYVPFEVLQKDLGWDPGTATDTRTGETVSIPGRTSDIQVSVKPGADLETARAHVQQAVDRIAIPRGLGLRYPYQVITWQKQHEVIVGAVEKEKVLMTFLFGMISLVAIFLIFCIFYMIVVEKTRDIGIIKSVGASSQGVAGIFLGYGAAIGIVGSGMGLLFGWLIVHYINELHDWLGRALGVTIWNKDVYLFDTIPNRMSPSESAIIVSVGIVAAVVGALVPAYRAARMQPVEALRWE